MATDSCRSAYLAGLFFLVVMLSACKMGPDYPVQRHRKPTPGVARVDGGIHCEFAPGGNF